MRRSSSRKTPFGYGIFPDSDLAPDVSVGAPSEQSTAHPCNGSLKNESPPTPQSRPAKEHPHQRNPSGFSSDTPWGGAVGKRGEPLTLAEILAYERTQGFIEPKDYDEAYEKLRQSGDATYLTELQQMSLTELIEEARRQRIDGISDNADRTDLIFGILKRRIKQNGLLFGEGTLEILPDQFGFLRSSEHHYLSCPDDIYISPSQIRRFGLRKGCTVSGQIRPPKENERYFALLRVEAINHEAPSLLSEKAFFDELTPIHPDRRILLDSVDGGVESRVIDLFVPIGFGQRVLIVGPPGSGKTALVRSLTRGIRANQSETFVFVLLLDPSPAVADETIRLRCGPHCEIISTTPDETPLRHVQVAEMVLEKAKRMVEYGKDVVVFLDSISILAKAWSGEMTSTNKSAGGMDSNVMRQVKKYFGSARKIEEGGSLTIIATTRIDSGDPFDNTVYDEFKGSCNSEIVLNADMAAQEVHPAVDLDQSGTRHEEILFDPEEYRRLTDLRKKIRGDSGESATKTVIDRMKRTETNAATPKGSFG